MSSKQQAIPTGPASTESSAAAPAPAVDQPMGNAAAAAATKGGPAPASGGEFGSDFSLLGALQATTAAMAEANSPEGKARIEAAHQKFVSYKGLAISKFGLIAQNQASAMDALQQAASKKKPPSLAQTVVTSAVTGAIGAATGGVGTLVAPLAADDLKGVVASAFKAAGDKAGAAASDAVGKQWTADADGAFAYFQSLKEAFPISAGQVGSEFNAQADARWDGAKGSVAQAEQLAKAMADTAEALQSQLSAGTVPAKTAAVDGWLCTVAQTATGSGGGATNMDGVEPGLISDPKGILFLDIMVGDPKSKGQPTILSAHIEGVPKELLDAAKIGTMDGRNLSQMRIPKHVTAHKQTSYDETTTVFKFGANEQGTIWNGIDNWLVVHGGGDVSNPTDDYAYQGAKKLLNEEMATLTLGGLLT